MLVKENNRIYDSSIANTDIAEETISVLSEYILGDITVRYITDRNRQVGLWLYPAHFTLPLSEKRRTLDNEKWARGHLKGRIAIKVEPLVHIKINGDDQPGEFGGGRTMKWSPSNERFHLVEQKVEDDKIVTILEDKSGLRIFHKLEEGTKGILKSETSFVNGSEKAVKLELFTSFSIGGISPYDSSDAGEKILVHRFRTGWSAEGQMVSESIEHLHLERTWAGKTHLSERFGQVGSMPTRGWFPTTLVEDTAAGVTWGARLEAPVSWQMEIGRRHDDIVMSGGIADREFGHWTKTIDTKETFTPPAAWLTCVAGTVDEACERLVSVDQQAAEEQPAIEQELPVIYNDWCTSWGEPSEEGLLDTAKKAAELGVKYFVIDAGWYTPTDKNTNWVTSFGDWIPEKERFPNGIRAVTEKIREYGMIPGIWFEPEYVARDSKAFQETEHLLKRDGVPLTVGVRRAWDLQDPYAIAYIHSRVTEFLRKSGFGYLKVDHSETLGIGVDHPDGLGEGLRCQGEGTLSLLESFRKELPELVIEITSAGGNRLEASILQRCSMNSCSDAHGVPEIPIIAASMHRLILPRQSQVWAVLLAADSPREMDYSLSAAFLGRMCLSGEIAQLSVGQRKRVSRAVSLYKRVVPVIKYGSSSIINRRNASLRHPKGWQAVVRIRENEGMIVVHTFEEAPDEISLHLPGSRWKITDSLSAAQTDIKGDVLKIYKMPGFSGNVFVIVRE
ncbi:alpha-galactosidase [Mediterraneibacter sp. NSJ-55]|uniref:Alpha-galactosidase n=1 Tax=Mediterraneibacter hominis TaxID=2763054 RepID=A0A923LLF7_9FIRM|nr:glycoside hydrolase family 36 protein [Mediterraneibacter hominis]MBC5690470.1 alpha-galactosidase [Mediterraneibacter hominis]